MCEMSCRRAPIIPSGRGTAVPCFGTSPPSAPASTSPEALPGRCAGLHRRRSASFPLKRLCEPKCIRAPTRRGGPKSAAKVQEALAGKAVSGHMERAQVLKGSLLGAFSRIFHAMWSSSDRTVSSANASNGLSEAARIESSTCRHENKGVLRTILSGDHIKRSSIPTSMHSCIRACAQTCACLHACMLYTCLPTNPPTCVYVRTYVPISVIHTYIH